MENSINGVTLSFLGGEDPFVGGKYFIGSLSVSFVNEEKDIIEIQLPLRNRRGHTLKVTRRGDPEGFERLLKIMEFIATLTFSTCS